MTTDFHDSLAFGGPLTSAYFNQRLGALDRAIGTMKRRGMRANAIDAGTNAAPALVAHRGLTRSIPENTMASFEAAVGAGARALEVDIQFTSDGVPIAMHDFQNIARTTPFTGGPLNYSWPELKAMEAGSFFHSYWGKETIPSLYELFERFGPSVTYLLEIKDGLTAGGSHVTAANRLADIAADYGLEDHVIIGSFSDLRTSNAWTDHGVPLLIFTDSPASDGSIGGVSPATFVAAGVRYCAFNYAISGLASPAQAWVDAGGKSLAWTVNNRFNRDVALSAAAITGLLTDDPLYVDPVADYTIPVGTNIPFNTPVVPTGVLHYFLSGTATTEGGPGGQFRVAVNDARIGWPFVDSVNDNHCLVLGSLGWGGSGIGKLTGDMTYESASPDLTRFGGLCIFTDDRGQVDGGTPSSTGYKALLRENGDLELYRIAGAAAVNIGTAAAPNLSASSTYPMTLEVTATHVIATGNGVSLNIADATYRNLNYPGIIRSRAAVTFDNLRRTI